ncbi:hypothetical protein [uncultured Hymenobacter sp.]|uniref:hypothetical protein n=1 Tax=uncultured Hymenobacter sp. TaxID=170016 RepID=UPI0035C9A787
MATQRPLLPGKDQPVMDNLLNALRADGHTVERTVNLNTVYQQFNARYFTLIGLGGGFNDKERKQLQQEFQLQNLGARVEDIVGPVGRTAQFSAKPSCPPTGARTVDGVTGRGATYSTPAYPPPK